MAKDRRHEFVYPLETTVERNGFPYRPQRGQRSSVLFPISGSGHANQLAVGASLNETNVWIYTIVPKHWDLISELLDREGSAQKLPSGILSQIDQKDHGGEIYLEHRIPRDRFEHIPFNVIYNDLVAYKDIAERILAIFENDEVVDEYAYEEGYYSEYFAEEGEFRRVERFERKRCSELTKRSKAALNEFTCSACGFNFEGVYGSLGQNFIELHHSKALGSMDAQGEIVRSSDLVPLCSNCHRMIHRRSPPLTVQELRKIIFDKI